MSPPNSAPSTPEAGGVGQVLASDDAPDSLAMDATTLYWIDRNPYCLEPGRRPCDVRVRALPKSGGKVTTLAQVPGQSFSIDTDDQYVYFGGVVGQQSCGRPTCSPVWTLYRVAKTGGTPQELASGLGSVSQWSVGDTVVYGAGVPEGQPWTVYGILAIPKDGSASVTVLSPGQRTANVQLGGSSLFWSVEDGIRRMDSRGGTPVQLFSQARMFPSQLSVDGERLSFLAQSSLWAAPAAGGPPRLLREGSPKHAVSSVDANQGNVYWTEPGCVGRIAPDGSGPRCLDQTDAEFRAVRVDDAAVYYFRARELIRLPK